MTNLVNGATAATADTTRRSACSGCGAYLSRYSDDTRCSVCIRSGFIPGAVWADPEVAAAVAQWNFGVLFRLLRSATGMSQNDLSALTGLSQGAISQIEAGTRRLCHIDRIQAVIERFQRCLSRVRTALVMTLMRLG
ncbi:helix-turn-helix domain-containing protein [Streptomyces sp. NPDC008079]|uniref:helix-turn-helix domain-containing protein n=1 Tax=Streptomyces sp. NPDC008079 TaxID=3364806 RepID=UPI0036ECC391